MQEQACLLAAKSLHSLQKKQLQKEQRSLLARALYVENSNPTKVFRHFAPANAIEQIFQETFLMLPNRCLFKADKQTKATINPTHPPLS